MKLKLLLLSLFSIVCLASCNSNKQNKEIVQVDNTLNILLSRQTFPNDSLLQYKMESIAPRSGVSCYFRKDSTFSIFFWQYGMSSGRYLGPEISGHYEYDISMGEISLIFDGESDEVGFYAHKPTPISFYTMSQLQGRDSDKITDMIDKDLPDYSKSCLKILEKKDNGEVLVDLYAYEKDRESVSFGEVWFSERELTAKDSVINRMMPF